MAVEWHEMEAIDEEIESLASRYLIESAQRQFLPTPEFSKDDSDRQKSTITGRYRPSLSAMKKLRSEIRKEKKESREDTIAWVTVIAGLLGILTGLVAVWKS